MILRGPDSRSVISLIDRYYPHFIFLILLVILFGCANERPPKVNQAQSPQGALVSEDATHEEQGPALAPPVIPSALGPVGNVNVFSSSKWVVSRQYAGENIPSKGRSLFDRIFRGDVPYPFSRVLDRVAELTSKDSVKVALIPLGRSLQRNSAHPDFFRFPRVVAAVNGDATGAFPFSIKDKLFLGFNERAKTIEVLSYNDLMGRFEFQIVEDYAVGKKAKVFYADRSVCLECHQNHAGIFSREPWGETNQAENTEIISYLKANIDGEHYQNSEWFPLEQKKESVVRKLDESTDRSNLIVLRQRLWVNGCFEPIFRCRKVGFKFAILHAMDPLSFAAESQVEYGDFVRRFDESWNRRWPVGLKLADPDLPNRNPLNPLKEGNHDIHLPVDLRVEADRVEEISQRKPNINFDDDPLKIREPLAVLRKEWGGPWHFMKGHDAIYKEWSEFLDPRDIAEIERYLFKHAEADTKLNFISNCNFHNEPVIGRPWKRIISGRCENEDLQFDIRLKVFEGDRVNGVFQNLEFRSGVLDRVEVTGNQISDGVFEFQLENGRHPVARRLSNGLSFSKFRIQFEPEDPTKGSVDTELWDVSAVLDNVLDKMTVSFGAELFSRERFLKELFTVLGEIETAKQFQSDFGSLPAPRVTHSASLPDFFEPFDGKFGELQNYCVRCHGRSQNKDLPQFLFGRFERVKDKIKKCAPRIYFRMMMWDYDGVSNSSSRKSPMPPRGFLTKKGISEVDWSKAREEMTQWLEQAYLGIESDAQRDKFFEKAFSDLPECHF